MKGAWVVRVGSEILLEQVGDFFACYEAERGETHLLDAFSAEILRLLLSAPRSREEVQDNLARQMGEETGQWVARMDEVLCELQQLRLVEQPLS